MKPAPTPQPDAVPKQPSGQQQPAQAGQTQQVQQLDAAMLSLRQPTVSQQLARLRAEGLVATRRDGKTIHYSLASEEARVVVGAVYEMFCGAK